MCGKCAYTRIISKLFPANSLNMFLGTAVCIVLLSCSSGIRPPEIYSSYGKRNYIFWSETRILKWADFQGSTPYLLNNEINVIRYAEINRLNLFGPTGFTAATIFDKTKSFVKEEAQTDTRLLYYQIIFNIHELYTRKFRRHYESVDFGLFNLKSDFNKTKINYDKESYERTEQLKKESNDGENKKVISEWNVKIKSELDQLIHYIVLF
ncbi:MAG: hypothetical protein CVV24_07455 [Ignavibacteriae bacterium HGW-Ignavibacteriae-3]|nr:MAG: hypothetical protein CVV24_07455 [Ignavibacteriae bacterium HGW-Ignavibacteriae-3]